MKVIDKPEAFGGDFVKSVCPGPKAVVEKILSNLSDQYARAREGHVKRVAI
jgi:hypothetical protein